MPHHNAINYCWVQLKEWDLCYGRLSTAIRWFLIIQSVPETVRSFRDKDWPVSERADVAGPALAVFSLFLCLYMLARLKNMAKSMPPFVLWLESATQNKVRLSQYSMFKFDNFGNIVLYHFHHILQKKLFHRVRVSGDVDHGTVICTKKRGKKEWSLVSACNLLHGWILIVHDPTLAFESWSYYSGH